MIIECINCSKKFDVNSDLIPSNGRTIQCGSCNHVWFYKKSHQNLLKEKKPEIQKKTITSTQKTETRKISKISSKKTKKIFEENKPINNIKGSEIIEYSPKSNFTFGKFLSYIIVIIISFIGVIVILDTFKSSLYNFFPNLEFSLFSLYETLKDIRLFIKDLI